MFGFFEKSGSELLSELETWVEALPPIKEMYPSSLAVQKVRELYGILKERLDKEPGLLNSKECKRLKVIGNIKGGFPL